MKDTVAFPILSATELEECAEFGTRCSFATGEDSVVQHGGFFYSSGEEKGLLNNGDVELR
jgi:hypothetical protein